MKSKHLTWTLSKFTLTLITCGLSTAAVQAENSTPPLSYYPYTIGVDAGTPGAGISAGLRFSDHFGARAGFDYFKFGHNGTVKDVDYDGHLQLGSEVLTLDWFPSKTRSFHVSAGVAFNENRLTGTGNNTTESVTINGTTYQPGQLGTVDLKIEQRLVNAYLSIGGNLFYFDHEHHWSLSGELGAMYGGNPRVTLTQSGGNGQVPQSQINKDLSAEQQKVQHYANDLPFWPVLKLGVNFSF